MSSVLWMFSSGHPSIYLAQQLLIQPLWMVEVPPVGAGTRMHAFSLRSIRWLAFVIVTHG